MFKYSFFLFNFFIILSGLYFLLDYKKDKCRSMYCKFSFYYFITNFLFDLIILLHLYTLTKCQAIMMIIGNIFLLYNIYNYPLLPIWLVLIGFITLYNIHDITNYENV